jgi:hypothetical protein
MGQDAAAQSGARDYTRAEWDWLEAEWAFHLHGRSAFISQEDYRQLRQWSQEGIPPEAVVNAMEAYFARRAKRKREGGYVALAHLQRDVAKHMQLRAALARAEPAAGAAGWEGVRPPLGADPRAKALFLAWKQLQAAAPSPDAPGFLEHFDAERKAFKDLLALAEERLGEQAEPLRAALVARLADSKLQEGTLVWRRAWEHHWSRVLCETWGIPA